MRNHSETPFAACPIFHLQTKLHAQCNQADSTSSEKLFARPVLVVAVRKVAPHNEGYFLFLQLLRGNLERIGHALYVDQDGRVTTTTR
jgi:hypothetical protein